MSYAEFTMVCNRLCEVEKREVARATARAWARYPDQEAAVDSSYALSRALMIAEAKVEAQDRKVIALKSECPMIWRTYYTRYFGA